MKKLFIDSEKQLSADLDHIKVVESDITEIDGERTQKYKRSKIVRTNAVTILLYNKTKDTVILVRQFRYPVWEKLTSIEILSVKESPGDWKLLEVVAGKVDCYETPFQAAVREVREETGYVIEEDDLIYTGQGFASPGYSDEIIYQFAAIVKSSDKKELGGGMEDEHEDIEVVEMPYLEFRNFVESSSIKDMKTRLAFYEASAAGVFSEKKEEKKKIAVFKNTKNENQTKIEI